MTRRALYFFTAFVLLLVMIIGSVCFSKQETFQLLNRYHSPLLDAFFINFTWFGDGLISIIAVILLTGFNQRKQAVSLLIAYLTSGLTAQILKHTFNHPRPKLFFEANKISFHFIENIRIYTEGSFPSGHTSSAFAMATVFSLFNPDQRFGMLALLLAAIEGYSRVYLGQHFLQDITAGAIIGIFFGLISYYATSYQFTRKNQNKLIGLGSRSSFVKELQ